MSLDLPSNLKSIRRSLKLRQSHIADALGLSISEISRIERGRRRLRVDQIEIWAKALGHRVSMVLYTGKPLLEDDEILLNRVATTLTHMTASEKGMLKGLLSSVPEDREMTGGKMRPGGSPYLNPYLS